MRVIKNINNNVAICLDSRGQEVVAFGKGIGFAKPPYDIDIARVQRTFYDIDPVYIDSIQHIPEEMLEVATKVIDFARTRVGYLMNSSVVFTLADHLAFTVKRFQGHMHLDMPLYHDVRVLYEEETEIGEYASASSTSALASVCPRRRRRASHFTSSTPAPLRARRPARPATQR